MRRRVQMQPSKVLTAVRTRGEPEAAAARPDVLNAPVGTHQRLLFCPLDAATRQNWPTRQNRPTRPPEKLRRLAAAGSSDPNPAWSSAAGPSGQNQVWQMERSRRTTRPRRPALTSFTGSSVPQLAPLAQKLRWCRVDPTSPTHQRAPLHNVETRLQRAQEAPGRSPTVSQTSVAFCPVSSECTVAFR